MKKKLPAVINPAEAVNAEIGWTRAYIKYTIKPIAFSFSRSTLHVVETKQKLSWKLRVVETKIRFVPFFLFLFGNFCFFFLFFVNFTKQGGSGGCFPMKSNYTSTFLEPMTHFQIPYRYVRTHTHTYMKQIKVIRYRKYLNRRNVPFTCVCVNK